MKRIEALKKFKSLVDQHGAPQVAVWFGLSSTDTIRTWFYRKEIPKFRHETLETLWREHGNN